MLYGWTVPTRTETLMAEQKLCTVFAGTVGDTKRNMKGSILTELVLWFFFLVPGLIYSIWRHKYRCASFVGIVEARQ